MSTADGRDERVDAVIAAYLEEAMAGRAPPRSELFARHPELAAELAAFFRDHDEVRRAARPAGERVRYFGDYEILEEVGRGGMGVVYKARQVSLNRVVALKMILAGQLATPADVRRFKAEAENAANLDHPHIVPLYEVGEHDGLPYYTMRFIDGGSLADWIKRRFTAEGAETAEIKQRENKSDRLSSPSFSALSALSAVKLLSTVARAVHHAHQRGVLHRDLKPGNILLSANREPHVADFGLARRLDATVSLSPTGAVVGTPAYMAPEQTVGAKGGLTVAADVYSLGAVLYECLTDRPPFAGETPFEVLQLVVGHEPAAPRTIEPSIPHDLETVCLKAMAKEPQRRYATAAELAEDLERWLRGEPTLARPVGAAGRLVRWSRRNPAVAALLLAVSVTLLAGTAVSTLFAVRAEQNAAAARQRERQAKDEKDAAAAARDEANTARRRAEVLALTVQQTAALPTNPGLALLLAVEAAERAEPRTAVHNNGLRAALQECREVRTLFAPDGPSTDSRLREHVGFTSVRFSPDGRLLVTTSERFFRDGTRYAGTEGKTARVWDVATGRLLHTLVVPGLWFHTAEFSPDGRRLVTTQEGVVRAHCAGGPKHVFSDRAVRLWDVTTGKEVRVLRGHTDRVVSASFSPDGRRLVTASWDNTARVWDAETGEPIRTLRGEQKCVLGAVWSADGQRLLTFTDAGERHSSGPRPDGPPAPDWDPPLPAEAVVGFDTFGFGSDSSGGGSDSVQLWDAGSGRPIPFQPPLPLRAGEKRTAAFAPGGKWVATRQGDDTSLWHAENGKHRATITSWLRPLVQFELNDPPRQLLVEPLSSGLVVWDGAAAGASASMSARDAASRPAFQDSRNLAAAPCCAAVAGVPALAVPEGPTVIVRSLETERPVDEDRRVLAVLKGHADRIAGCAFRLNGRMLATASLDGTVRLWEVAREDGCATTLTAADGAGWARFSPDGQLVVTAKGPEERGQSVSVWNADGRAVAVLRTHEEVEKQSLREALRGELRDARFSPDGRLLVTVHHDRNPRTERKGGEPKASPLFTPVRLWDVRTGKLVRTLEGFNRSVATAAFSPDGRRLLTYSDGFDRYALLDANGEPRGSGGGGSGKSQVHVWDVATGKPLRALLPPGGPYCSGASWGADGRRVVTAGNGPNDTTQVWGVEEGRLLLTCERGPGAVDRVGVSPDGRWLLGWRQSYVENRDRVLLWDAESGKLQATLMAHRGEVTWTGFSPDGRLATTGTDRAARLWDPSSGKEVLQLLGHEKEVLTAAFSTDGRWLVTGSADTTARVWDTTTGREWITLVGHRGSVTSVGFSPDGRTVLTSSPDGTTRLWPFDPLPAARARRPRAFTEAERLRYLGAGEG